MLHVHRIAALAATLICRGLPDAGPDAGERSGHRERSRGAARTVRPELSAGDDVHPFEQRPATRPVGRPGTGGVHDRRRGLRTADHVHRRVRTRLAGLLRSGGAVTGPGAVNTARHQASKAVVSQTKESCNETSPPRSRPACWSSPSPPAAPSRRTRRPRSRPRSARSRRPRSRSSTRPSPKLKEAVANAPGYAVFTTYGFSFIIGGAGGKGARPGQQDEAGRPTWTWRRRAPGSRSAPRESETLIIFKTPKALQQFIDKGWEAGGGAAAQAGAGGKSVGAGGGEQVIADASYYTLTKNGLQAGVARRRDEVLEGQGAQLSAPARGESSASQMRGHGRGCDRAPRLAPGGRRA